MSVAGTHINNEPLSTSLLGDDKEPSVFNSIFNQRDGAGLNQIANETHIVTLAVLENWISPNWVSISAISASGRSYAAYTHPGSNELSCSGMTQG